MDLISEWSGFKRNRRTFKRYLRNSVFFILSFWLLNQIASLFTVEEGVSLFYPPSAFAMLLIYRFGPSYLPVHFLAILIGGLPDRDVFNYSFELFVPDFRQFLIYGLTGLALRAWHSDLTVIDARFLYGLIIASLASAGLSTLVFASQIGFNPGVTEPEDNLIPSFFVGNLTGAVSAIPIFLLYHRIKAIGWQSFKSSFLAQFLRRDTLIAAIVVASLTVVVVQLGRMNGNASAFYYLILIPIVWASVKWGLGVGLTFAFLGNLLALKLFIVLGASNYGVLEVQLMFAVSIVTAILIGLVQDQKDTFYRHSMYDELTGIANMRLFKEITDKALASAARKGQQNALLFVDLDGFKLVNDLYGHKAGDALLQGIGQSIKHCIRRSDCAARFGGDEFVVHLDDTSMDGATAVARNIIGNIAGLRLSDNDVSTISASIGIAMFPQDASDLDSLLREADRAMYKVKNSGKRDYGLAGKD